MWKVWVGVAAILVVCAACGNGDDDTNSSAGTGQGATGGATNAGSAGSGGTAAGAGGSGATGGSAAGGKGGGGSSNAGGAGLEIPKPTGTIGTGISCPHGGDTPCPDGQACCSAPLSGSPPSACVNAFDDCACSLTGTCTVFGCDSPDDCGGGHCCALNNPRMSPTFVATSCKPACESGERELCVSDADCPTGDQCMHGSQFDWCF